MLLDVVLNLLFQLVRPLSTGHQHNAGLHHLAPHLVRRGGYAALQHVGQLHDDTLNLKGPDAVAGGLDHVVRPAHVPQVSILVLPRHVPGVVEAVVPHALGLLLVPEIAGEQAAGSLALLRPDADLPVLAGGRRLAVGVYQHQVVAGDGLAHGADLLLVANEVADAQGGLRLAEALVDLEPRLGLKLAEDLRVQGLAGGGGVLDAAQVVPAQIVLDEHPVHSGRGAEGGDVIFGEHGQNVRGIKPVEVVGEHRPLAQPLAVELAPQGLAPAGLADGEVEPVGVDAVPVFGGDVVPQGILVALGGDLGVAGGAGGEEHQHRVVPRRGVRRPLELAAVHGVLLVEVVPALTLAAYQDLQPQAGAVLLGDVHLTGGVPVGGAEDGADLGGVEAVGEVVLLELVGGGDGHGPQLVEPQDGEPELIMPLEHQHHPVPLPDSQGLEVVGRPGGGSGHVLEGEAPLRLVLVQVQHGQLPGVFGGNGVHAVEGEVEPLCVGEGEAPQAPVFVLLGLDEGFAHVVLAGAGPDDGLAHGLLVGLLAGDHHRAEHALPAAHGDHPVRGGGVVEDAVPLLQDLRVLPHLDLQLAGEDDVKLLAGVGGEVDGHVLLGLVVVVGDVVGLRQLIAEEGGQVADLNARLLGGLLALPSPGDGVAAQVGAVALQQVGDADAEGQGALVDEGEGQIRPAGLVGAVLHNGGVGPAGHLLLGKAADGPHLPNAEGHLHQLGVDTVGIHSVSS